jgi:predicted transcriptional regulator
MEVALSRAELRVMSVVWHEGGNTTARHIADVLADQVGYSAAASYTLVGRCVKKGALERSEPGYMCRALVSQEDMQNSETDALIERLFDGSADKLFVALVDRKKVSQHEIDRLRTVPEGAAR